MGVLGAGGLHPCGRKAAEGDLQLGGERREADAHVQRAHHAGEAPPSPSVPPRPLTAAWGPSSRPGSHLQTWRLRAALLPFAFTGLCRSGAASPSRAVLCSQARQAGATAEAGRQSDDRARRPLGYSCLVTAIAELRQIAAPPVPHCRPTPCPQARPRWSTV